MIVKLASPATALSLVARRALTQLPAIFRRCALLSTLLL